MGRSSEGHIVGLDLRFEQRCGDAAAALRGKIHCEFGAFLAVLVPELVERRWYHYLLHSHTATTLELQLLFRGGPQVVIVNAPWHVGERRLRRAGVKRRRRFGTRAPEAPTRPVQAS